MKLFSRGPQTADEIMGYLNRHSAACKKGCGRDADGWAHYSRMCEVGQRIVQKLIDAP